MVKKSFQLPLFGLIILPSLVGVILISTISWRLFDPAVEKSSEIALKVLEEMIKTTGSESLSYPLAVGDEDGVKRLVAAMARNDLVFAVQVEDTEGNLVARVQNHELPIGEGIQLIEYREKLTIETLNADEPLLEGTTATTTYVGEVLFQLTPYVLKAEKERLISEYRIMIGALVALGLMLILLATQILRKSVASIKEGLARIAAGERDVAIDTDSIVSEFEVISRGVNRLSQNVDEARRQQLEALAEMEDAAEKARKSDRETRAFYDTATREIADPVMQLVELLKLNKHSDGSPIDPDLILDSAERVQLSVLAMLGKLDEKRGGDGEHEVELGDYFEMLEERYRARFRNKHLNYNVEAKGGAEHDKYKVDVRALDIVLEKLIENALKFTPEGEVRIHWGVSVSEGRNYLNISVRDNGVGIDQENLDNIFERYSHFESDGETIPSSGLGLYIAKQLIHRQGGTLSVNSQKGVGSDFTVRVPITRGGLVEQEHYDVKGKIALIVGTSEREKQFIKDQLGHLEMVCLHADTAIEALAQLAEHQIDIILVDDSVADIDVESFIAEARKRQAKMLIAVLSEEEHVGDKYSVIKKPIRKEALTAVARKMATPNLAGVDYGLIDRLNARRDKDGI